MEPAHPSESARILVRTGKARQELARWESGISLGAGTSPGAGVPLAAGATTGRLDARARQILILMDGRRSLVDVARLLGVETIDRHLDQLLRGGYLAPIDDPAGGFMRTPAILGPEAVEPATRPDPVNDARARMIGALLEIAGPAAREMANRLGRCSTIAELRELLPAAVSIVEAVAGRQATYAFLERAGRI